MRPTRIILFAVLAIAVALLPILGGMAAAASVQTVSASDCCHDQTPCDDGPALGDCAAMSVCAVKCFNFVGLPQVAVVPALMTTMVAIPASPVAVSQAIPPPLRPPRV
jgi:hypothetical protein